MNNQVPPEPVYEDDPFTDEKPVKTATGESTELISRPSSFEGMQFYNPEELPDLENADEGINIAPQYLEFINVDERVRAVYNGLTQITSTKNGERRSIPAAVFQNEKGIFINAGANLVNQMKTLRAGAFIQIVYKGKEKTQAGNEIKKYEVHLLKLQAIEN